MEVGISHDASPREGHGLWLELVLGFKYRYSFFLKMCIHFLYISFCCLSVCLSVGGTAEKDRSAPSHDAFLLMANSQNDMEDWVKAIRRVIWAPFGGGSTFSMLVKGKKFKHPTYAHFHSYPFGYIG